MKFLRDIFKTDCCVALGALVFSTIAYLGVICGFCYCFCQL